LIDALHWRLWFGALLFPPGLSERGDPEQAEDCDDEDRYSH
jgi:hypothetical protein